MDLSQHQAWFDDDALDRWIGKACASLYTFWDPAHQTFWRDSFYEQSDVPDSDAADDPRLGAGKGATSNNRAFQGSSRHAWHWPTSRRGRWGRRSSMTSVRSLRR